MSAKGSTKSHVAILARNMNIPAVVGVGEELLKKLSDGQMAIIDGFDGSLIIDPDDATIKQYQEMKATYEKSKSSLHSKFIS